MLTQESFQKQYDVDTTGVMIRDRRFSFFVVRALDSFVDPDDIFRDFQSISKFFRTYLNDGGEIIVAEGIRKTSMEFMRQMQCL